ncbi:uncharacterized protein LOC122306298 [Carya illinoinensis]|uniref:uncharacterized protein LOC122306298 n=1 Tax=Carya illinoinensis TaxID=32201 RepID=UPI001C71F79A|nr:uncharacterized protein LOC122306298 [Carya illinoinensis]
MKTISWNSRGLGNPRGVRTLRDLVRREDPEVLFLMETKMSSWQMERIRVSMGFGCCFTVPSEGRSGGLALLWKNEVNLSIKSFSFFHIDAKISEIDNGLEWKFTSLYRHPETEKRVETWSLLRTLNEDAYSDHLPIILIPSSSHNRYRQKLFRFEAMWVEDDECGDVISRCWNGATDNRPMDSFIDRLRICSRGLETWNKMKFGHYGNDRDQLIISYFQSLFQSEQQVPMEDLVFLEDLRGRVIDDMNVELTKDFTKEEVKEALNQMHPTKSPGPDGMPPLFFQQYWHIVGNAVTCAVLQLISKVLANRLKKVLNAVISTSQCAFVPGRIISDNILVAYEVVHFLRQKRKGKEGYMSIKLDMILSNGEPKGPIIPSRGLSQGDPLSPHLFLLCTEGLISLLKKAEEHGKITPVRIYSGAPRLSHLIFVDDSILFCKANVYENQRIQHLLHCYEQSSGQKINRGKTGIVFSTNVKPDTRQDILDLWEVQHSQQFEKYLGLPPLVGRAKYRAFSDIKHKVWKKLHGWKEKMLSVGGKEILIKAVALSIPTYAMNCFKLPSSLCAELEQLMEKFWWGQKKEEHKIHWMSWSKMCNTKQNGGMGFKDLRVFNEALLAKNGWRIMQNTESLLHKIFKARYFPKKHFLDAALGYNPSFVWRGIWGTKRKLQEGCQWRIGSGKEVRIWTDSWVPGFTSIAGQHISPSYYGNAELIGDESATVNSLFIANQRVWDVGKITAFFRPEVALHITKIVLSQDREDLIRWKKEANGTYTVKSAYRLFKDLSPGRQNGESSNVDLLRKMWKAIWSMKLPIKVRIFAWKAVKEILPTKSNLKKKKVLTEDGCVFCHAKNEDTLHALCSCPAIKEVWSLYFPSMVLMKEHDMFLDVVLRLQHNKRHDMLDLFFIICWSCWYRRNMKMFENKAMSIDAILGNALAMQKSYKELKNKPISIIRNQYRWELPPPGVFKLNVDGVFSSSGSIAGIGAIVRDSKGKVIMSAAKKECSAMTVVEVEALAILQGLQFCIHLGISNLVIESDS